MTQSGISLREYRESDLEAMFQLDQVCFPEPFRFDRYTMRRFAESQNAMGLVAERADGSLAGFAIIHLETNGRDRYAYVVTLDVAPEDRRKGLAGELLQTLEMQAWAQGALRMELHVAAGNERAIPFYEKCGYTSAGLQKDFYGKGLDALGYWKALG